MIKNSIEKIINEKLHRIEMELKVWCREQSVAQERSHRRHEKHIEANREHGKVVEGYLKALNELLEKKL
jgi:hypothetical protein